MMLFLGAGASKPFGIKTMKEMSEEFENSTDLTKDERELYLDIKNTLGSDNLEDILTVLNDLTKSSPDPSIRYFNSKLDFFFDEFNKTLIELSGLLRELERKKVAIVGVGDAGLNTIDQLQGIKIEDSEIIAINTDSEHLNLIRGADKKKIIGESLTRGLGAHGSPEIGEKVALLSEDIIKEALEDKDFVFIVAGMGGGTGSGTSPIIARIAKEEGAFVVCLVTLPFKVEEKRRIRAKEWLKRLRKEADRVVTFDNETLLEDVPNLPLNKAFSVMTQLMAINIKGTFEMIKDSEHSIAKKREWINQKLKEILKHTKAENKYPLSDSNLSRELKSKIISLIKENCILKEKRENIAKIYDQLFKIIETHCYLTIDIFTANYDPVIENYIKNLSFLTYDIGHDELTKLGCHLYYDGFQNSIWHPEGYDENIARDLDDMIIVRNEKGETLIEEYTENKILPIFRLFKLHGSIDQYYQNGEIIKKDILFPTKTVEGVELKDSMIYPMREKEVYEDPFFELFTRLKNSLLSEKICIVIGYSFGDEHIRNIFFDAMKRNPEIKIFMINPKAKEIRDDLKPIKDKIDPIEGEFGEESIFEELEEKLKELEGI